jgi:hypothetical protein
MALGPMFGSLLIHFTGKTLSVFFVAGLLHVAYTFLVWFILPESLSKEKMENAKIKYTTGLLEAANEREQNPAFGFLVKLRRAFAFLSPLTIFMPEEKGSSNPLKKPKEDWNLTLMALVFAFTISLTVCCQNPTRFSALKKWQRVRIHINTNTLLRRLDGIHKRSVISSPL